MKKVCKHTLDTERQFEEWLRLLMQAKELGLTVEEVRCFLQNAQKHS
ncbi:DNA-binding anti-repressor SinI [Bacillus sp. B190/17]|uniref:DNA-binding anti-repressor SinI n=1 Tax=Bacillus lumedeiriae TaxID=3058829 RepID=A0ABW8IB22_9BACI